MGAESNSRGGDSDTNLLDEKSGNGRPRLDDNNSQEQESGALEDNFEPAAAAELAGKNPPNNSELLDGHQLAVIDGPLAKVMPDEGIIHRGTGMS